MRTLRPALAGTVILALLGGLGSGVVAQSEAEATPQALTEFTGRTECFGLSLGTLEDVVIGSTDEGDLIRREWRGPNVSVFVREISDPRLDCEITSWFNTDEYLIASDETPWQLLPDAPEEWPRGVTAGAMRCTNAAGSWFDSGGYSNVYLNGDNSTYTAVLTGEGAYDGLTALMEMDFDELNPVCAWDVHGYIIEGQLPPMPEPEPPVQ